ncbi:MAG TPA: 50S ribosomal protein L9 [Xanthobacteraceae bacterium]|nr:50S ribosomal protein L9 [Xanthobacteraceae bacterium]
MNVILLERVAKLGQIGEVVRVKDGFARNFLLPLGKALRATKDNRTKFESMKVQLEARNLELKAEAAKVGETLAGTELIIVRQAGETGHLYGSVSTRDIAEGLTAAGFTVSRQQILLNQPLKTVGVHEVLVSLHPEVEVTVLANIARSADEAVRQSRGEDLSVNRDDDEDEDFEADAEEETDGEAA